ncbi:DUF2905 family protein [Coprothermobacter platensis]|uniref:DUF2905 family protein n=1 Tax=Coprothermobacter platensis TaxID=108819 RepID=UPI0009FFBAB8
MNGIARALIVAGLSLLILGLLLWVFSSTRLRLIPFGRLPGDIYIKRGNFVFYAPIVSFLILSLLLTLFVNIIVRIFFH